MLPICVVNNYGQFNHLIHRTLRDLDIDIVLIPNTTPTAEVASTSPWDYSGRRSDNRACWKVFWISGSGTSSPWDLSGSSYYSKKIWWWCSSGKIWGIWVDRSQYLWPWRHPYRISWKNSGLGITRGWSLQGATGFYTARQLPYMRSRGYCVPTKKDLWSSVASWSQPYAGREDGLWEF